MLLLSLAALLLAVCCARCASVATDYRAEYVTQRPLRAAPSIDVDLSEFHALATEQLLLARGRGNSQVSDEVTISNVYVSPTGSDGNSGDSPQTAFATFDRAASALVGLSNANLFFAPGVYSVDSGLNLTGSNITVQMYTAGGGAPLPTDEVVWSCKPNRTVRTPLLYALKVTNLVLSGPITMQNCLQSLMLWSTGNAVLNQLSITGSPFPVTVYQSHDIAWNGGKVYNCSNDGSKLQRYMFLIMWENNVWYPNGMVFNDVEFFDLDVQAAPLYRSNMWWVMTPLQFNRCQFHDMALYRKFPELQPDGIFYINSGVGFDSCQFINNLLESGALVLYYNYAIGSCRACVREFRNCLFRGNMGDSGVVRFFVDEEASMLPVFHVTVSIIDTLFEKNYVYTGAALVNENDAISCLRCRFVNNVHMRNNNKIHGFRTASSFIDVSTRSTQLGVTNFTDCFFNDSRSISIQGIQVVTAYMGGVSVPEFHRCVFIIGSTMHTTLHLTEAANPKFNMCNFTTDEGGIADNSWSIKITEAAQMMAVACRFVVNVTSHYEDEVLGTASSAFEIFSLTGFSNIYLVASQVFALGTLVDLPPTPSSMNLTQMYAAPIIFSLQDDATVHALSCEFHSFNATALLLKLDGGILSQTQGRFDAHNNIVASLVTGRFSDYPVMLVGAEASFITSSFQNIEVEPIHVADNENKGIGVAHLLFCLYFNARLNIVNSIIMLNEELPHPVLPFSVSGSTLILAKSTIVTRDIPVAISIEDDRTKMSAVPSNLTFDFTHFVSPGGVAPFNCTEHNIVNGTLSADYSLLPQHCNNASDFGIADMGRFYLVDPLKLVYFDLGVGSQGLARFFVDSTVASLNFTLDVIADSSTGMSPPSGPGLVRLDIYRSRPNDTISILEHGTRHWTTSSGSLFIDFKDAAFQPNFVYIVQLVSLIPPTSMAASPRAPGAAMLRGRGGDRLKLNDNMPYLPWFQRFVLSIYAEPVKISLKMSQLRANGWWGSGVYICQSHIDFVLQLRDEIGFTQLAREFDERIVFVLEDSKHRALTQLSKNTMGDYMVTYRPTKQGRYYVMISVDGGMTFSEMKSLYVHWNGWVYVIAATMMILVVLLVGYGVHRVWKRKHLKVAQKLVMQEQRLMEYEAWEKGMAVSKVSTLSWEGMMDSLPELSSVEAPWMSVPQFEYAEISSHLTEKNRISKGGFGEVFKCKWRDQMVAVKKLFVTGRNAQAIHASFVEEVSFLYATDHPNVLKVFGACFTMPNLCFITRLMELGTLYRILHNEEIAPRLHLQRRVDLAVQIARAIEYLHSQSPPIIHRDLKSVNVLVGKDFDVKIGDFGLARRLNEDFLSTVHQGGTPAWMSPQQLRGERIDEKADIYAYGVILWEIFTGKLPWEGKAFVDIVRDVGINHERLNVMDILVFDGLNRTLNMPDHVDGPQYNPPAAPPPALRLLSSTRDLHGDDEEDTSAAMNTTEREHEALLRSQHNSFLLSSRSGADTDGSSDLLSSVAGRLDGGGDGGDRAAVRTSKLGKFEHVTRSEKTISAGVTQPLEMSPISMNPRFEAFVEVYVRSECVKVCTACFKENPTQRPPAATLVRILENLREFLNKHQLN